MPDEALEQLKNAHGGIWGEHPRFPVADWHYEVANNDTRQGYWEWVEICLEDDPDPGPTGPGLRAGYSVWIAEPAAHVLRRALSGFTPGHSGKDWEWIHDQTFTCGDDPDGIGARRNAHEYARYLRRTYPCAYVAVLPAGKAPKPIHQHISPKP